MMTILRAGTALASSLMLVVSALAADAPSLMGNYDVFYMTKKGVPADQIIREIRASEPRFQLEAEEIAKLTNNGVSQPVIASTLR